MGRSEWFDDDIDLGSCAVMDTCRWDTQGHISRARSAERVMGEKAGKNVIGRRTISEMPRGKARALGNCAVGRGVIIIDA